MLTADNLAKYLYYQVYCVRETKYILIKHICKAPKTELKKYADNMLIIGNALLKMSEDGEYH